MFRNGLKTEVGCLNGYTVSVVRLFAHVVEDWVAACFARTNTQYCTHGLSIQFGMAMKCG
jgi:hypothetical protein